MFQKESTILDGAYTFILPAFEDERGVFVKTFQDSMLREAGIEFVIKESYFSVSRKDVIRGMHFQLPPHQHGKIVFCPVGEILDVIVDLRKSSATFGRFIAVELSAANHKAIYIPPGFAHGFRTIEENSITYYLVSSEYDKESDSGIMFDSFGMEWGITQPVVSARDRSFHHLSDWEPVF